MNWIIQHWETEVVMCLVSSQFWWIFIFVLLQCDEDMYGLRNTYKNRCCMRQPGFHPSKWQIWQHMMWHPSLVRHLQPANVQPHLWWFLRSFPESKMHQIYRPVIHQTPIKEIFQWYAGSHFFTGRTSRVLHVCSEWLGLEPNSTRRPNRHCPVDPQVPWATILRTEMQMPHELFKIPLLSG